MNTSLTLSAIVYYMLTIAWFGFWGIGFIATVAHMINKQVNRKPWSNPFDE